MRKDVNTEDEMSVTLNPNASLPWWVNTPGIALGHFGGSSDTGGVRYWSMRVAGTVYQTSIPVVVGQTAQLVCTIAFGATNTVSLYVNPPAAALPSTPAVTVSATSSVSFRSLEWYAGTGAGETPSTKSASPAATPVSPERRQPRLHPPPISPPLQATARSHSHGPPSRWLLLTTFTR